MSKTGNRMRRRKRILGVSAMILAMLIAVLPTFSHAATYTDDSDRINVVNNTTSGSTFDIRIDTGDTEWSGDWGFDFTVSDPNVDRAYFLRNYLKKLDVYWDEENPSSVCWYDISSSLYSSDPTTFPRKSISLLVSSEFTKGKEESYLRELMASKGIRAFYCPVGGTADSVSEVVCQFNDMDHPVAVPSDGPGSYCIVFPSYLDMSDYEIVIPTNPTLMERGSTISWNASAPEDVNTGNFYVRHKKDHEKILTPKEDYTWTPVSINTIGPQTVSVNGINAYEGTLTKEFETKEKYAHSTSSSSSYSASFKIVVVNQVKKLVNGSVSWNASPNTTDGDFYVVYRVYSNNEIILEPGKDYEWEPRSVNSPGEKTFTVTGIGDYKGRLHVQGTFTVEEGPKNPLSGYKIVVVNRVKKLVNGSVSWNASPNKTDGDFYVVDETGEKFLTPGKDYDWSPKTADSIGQKEFTVTGIVDFEGGSLGPDTFIVEEEENYDDVTIENNSSIGGDPFIIRARRYPRQNKHPSLYIGIGDGRRIRGKYTYPARGRMIPFKLYLMEDGGIVRKGGTTEVILRLPTGMDPAKGSIQLVGIEYSGKPTEYTYEIVYEDGYPCLKFMGILPSDFGIIYVPNEEVFSSGTDLGIKDERADKAHPEVISGKLHPSVSANNLFLKVTDGSADKLTAAFELTEGQVLKPYHLSIEDAQGNTYSDYLTAEIILPLPDDADPAAGAIDVLGIDKDGFPVLYNGEIIEVNGVKAVKFNGVFPGEIGIRYTPGKGSGGGDSGGGDSGGGSGGGGDSGGGSGGGSGDGGGSGGSSGGGSGGGSGSGGGGAGIGMPVPGTGISPVYQMADRNKKSGKSGSGAGSYGNNAQDMPRTGEGDSVRYLLSVMIFAFGCILVLSTISTKKKVIVRQD